MNTTDTANIIIFGASGDLTWRKLIPALYNNYKKGRLTNCANILGVARREYTDDDFREHLRTGVEQFSPQTYDEAIWNEFAQMLSYCVGDFTQEDTYHNLKLALEELETSPTHRLYYLATSPESYAEIAGHLEGKGMSRNPGDQSVWRRIIIEKPFGHDLRSARELNQALSRAFSEEQIYRIDHYLGKETTQNILFFRFANTIFEPIWNRRYISNVQVTVAETVDVGTRAGYYDQIGVLRDMFQNHLFQLLALVAMEPPVSFTAAPIRNEKVKVFQSIRPIDLKDTIRAQYAGYRSSKDIAEDSQTPTYAAIKLLIDNWRWQGVPFYLRSGKALRQKTTEIVIEFKRPPHMMFDLKLDQDFSPNILSICIQPDEGIHLRFEAKALDSDQELQSVDMTFHYRTSFGDSLIPEAYERLLLEALDGDPSLFTRADGIEAAWEIIDPVILGWEKYDDPGLLTYEPGSWGPEEGDVLLQQSGHQWHLGCKD